MTRLRLSGLEAEAGIAYLQFKLLIINVDYLEPPRLKPDDSMNIRTMAHLSNYS